MRVFLLFLLTCNLYAEKIYASFDVLALNSAKLAIPAVGIVDKVYVNIASKVKKGDLLLELDSSVEKVALENAKAELKLAQNALEHAKSTLNRYMMVKSVLNQQLIDDISLKKSEAESKLAMASSGIAKYKTLIKQKTLKAPFDGIVSAKFIEVGEGVASPAQTLLVLDSYPKVKLLLSFDEKYDGLVKIGDTYEYTLNNLKMNGKISKIYPNIDIKTRKIYAEVLANELTIGSFGEGYIITGE